MLAAQPAEGQPLGARVATKVFAAPFFIVHYGIFWLVHGIFLVTFFGGDSPAISGQSQSFFLAPIVASWLRADVLAWPVAVMLVSHGVSFVSNFLASGEYRSSGINELMMRSYGRVVVLHLTILAGGFLALSLGPSPAVLVLFVVVKIVADVVAQQREQRRVSAARVLRMDLTV